jgi:hypothetical protein
MLSVTRSLTHTLELQTWAAPELTTPGYGAHEIMRYRTMIIRFQFILYC